LNDGLEGYKLEQPSVPIREEYMHKSTILGLVSKAALAGGIKVW